MTDDAVPLRIPVIDREWSNLELALALANAGIYVLPTRGDGDAKHAGSVLGVGWPAKSSRDPQVIVSWFAGTSHRVAIHCGRSGLVVFDVDHPDRTPEKLAKAIANEVPPFQNTRPDEPTRGHLVFAQPPGRRIGNRAGELGKDFGEVRGANGIILVGGPGREWLQTGDVPELPSYLAELLPDVGDAETAVSDDELFRFVVAHTSELQPKTMGAVLDGFERQVATGGSRHDAMVAHACWAAREIIAGRYSAQKVLHRLERLFVEAMAVAPSPGERALTREQAEGEFRSGVAWALGQEWHPDGAEVDEDLPDLAGEARAAWLESEVAAEVERLRIRELARQRLAAERNVHRPAIAAGVLDDLDAIEAPTMLVGQLIPDDAVGFLAGRSGAYKSFLATAWGCCVATGRPWLGRAEFAVRRPLRTLYVAAEGASGAAGRIKAWEAATGVSRRGRLLVYPRPVHLNDPAQVDELAAYVAEHGVEFVVIDTYHRAAPGVDENDATEFGVVFAAAARLRDDHGCGVLFVDHTGHNGDGRPRGSSAKGDDADYVLSAGYDGPTRGPGVQRTLTVVKLKDEESGAQWPIRLSATEEGQRFPTVEIGVVEVSSPFVVGDGAQWWTFELAPELLELLSGGEGRHAALDIVRVLILADKDHDGLTGAMIRRVMKDGPRKHSDSSVTAATALLKGKNIAVNNGQTQRLQLAEHWRPSE